ncbi:MAG: glycosyltransferase family 4 protein [Clostridia bacterium]|nr:glycosyltransferase family 4 protein [Clostridia bacterium]
MKVLWIVNMVLPELAEHLGVQTSPSGTWMIDLSNKIAADDNIELAVACVFGNEFKRIEHNQKIYYLLPGGGKQLLFYNKNFSTYWEQIEKDFCPDLVHIHGTEYSHSISYMRRFPEKKYLLTIQGIISKIAEKNDGELTFWQKLRYRTLFDNLHFKGMFESKLLMKKNSKYEKEIISRCSYATGRTDWDKFFMQSVNKELKYFRVNYNLRDEFYKSDKWSMENIDRHTIYASNSPQTPFKGGHIALKALAIVKEKYPDVKMRILSAKDADGNIKVRVGYSKYCHKLIGKFALKDNLEFLPRQNAEGVINVMKTSHLCVIPSSMENASATLREAMHIGTPCLASYRGGMTHLLKDGISGFFFDFNEHEYLAGRIIELFENDDLAVKFSKNAIKDAETMHDRVKNIKDMIDVYNKIVLE